MTRSFLVHCQVEPRGLRTCHFLVEVPHSIEAILTSRIQNDSTKSIIAKAIGRCFRWHIARGRRRPMSPPPII